MPTLLSRNELAANPRLYAATCRYFERQPPVSTNPNPTNALFAGSLHDPDYAPSPYEWMTAVLSGEAQRYEASLHPLALTASTCMLCSLKVPNVEDHMEQSHAEYWRRAFRSYARTGQCSCPMTPRDFAGLYLYVACLFEQLGDGQLLEEDEREFAAFLRECCYDLELLSPRSKQKFGFGGRRYDALHLMILGWVDNSSIYLRRGSSRRN